MRIIYLPRGVIVFWKVDKGRKNTLDQMAQFFNFSETAGKVLRSVTKTMKKKQNVIVAFCF